MTDLHKTEANRDLSLNRLTG